MGHYSIERKSHCRVCGTRLSALQPSGNVQWMLCHVDDRGLYCLNCFKPKSTGKNGKSAAAGVRQR
jgi:hypothetical protein